jgi:hypothetical protein
MFVGGQAQVTCSRWMSRQRRDFDVEGAVHGGLCHGHSHLGEPARGRALDHGEALRDARHPVLRYGGHIAIAWFERARSWIAARLGKRDPGRVDYLKLMPLTYAVVLIGGAFTLLTVTADIINPITIR